MKADFQDAQTHHFAEALYTGLEGKLAEAIIKFLNLEDVYTDEEGNKMPVDFRYAYGVLRDQGYMLNHVIDEEGGKATMKISFYKLETVVEYDVKTTFNISITRK